MDEIDDVEITPLHFLEAVYCNPNLPLNTRMRAAIEAAPYKHPKLSVSAVAKMDGNSFAEALDRAIARSQSPPLLNDPDTGGPLVMVRASREFVDCLAAGPPNCSSLEMQSGRAIADPPTIRRPRLLR